MDLTLTQTIHNFTNIHYVIPHVGGAFPAIEDRFLKSFPGLETRSKEIYNTRRVAFPCRWKCTHDLAGSGGIAQGQLILPK